MIPDRYGKMWAWHSDSGIREELVPAEDGASGGGRGEGKVRVRWREEEWRGGRVNIIIECLLRSMKYWCMLKAG